MFYNNSYLLPFDVSAHFKRIFIYLFNTVVEKPNRPEVWKTDKIFEFNMSEIILPVTDKYKVKK